MAEKNNTHVVYKALADFTALTKAARNARRELAELRKEEARLNAQSVAGSAASAAATGKHAKSRDQLIASFEKEAGSVKNSTVRFIENSKAVKENSDAVEKNSSSVNLLTGEITKTDSVSKSLTETIAKTATAHRNSKRAADSSSTSFRRNRTEVNRLEQGFNSTLKSAKQLQRGLDKLDDWRPRLVPPFIALIPLIASVIALINPLIAGLGAVGAAGLGFASSLGRVAAGAIGVIPALATLISMVAALKTAFGGIGNAFKAFGAMQKAAGGGGGGGGAPQKEELTRTEKLQRAQEALARSIQDVMYAQEDLDDARKDYIKRLRELQKAVDRAALSEARAAANSQLARENYMNVMADPGSTKGDKMDAQVSVGEAETDLQDTVDKNIENAADLNKMKQDGIKGDRQVVMATRRVTDAIWAQRDAQLALNNALKDTGAAGGGGGAAKAADEYAAALAKLSPSARRFVEQLVAMKDAWDAVKKNVQESFFSEFVDDIYLLRQILPSVESLLSNTAGAVGRVVDRFLKLITSPDWQRDLILIGEQNVPIIENVGDALLAWVDAFKDLTIAAGPFLTMLTKGMKEGAENFRRIVSDARGDNSLATYLEDVRQRMSQWWRIVKNIGKALFNYSAAAADFGTWLTNGFEKVTQGWLKSSEKAREAGSPFQKYLEAIEPLLSEVKGLFADFFGWFARTSADPKNIGGFLDIVKTIREDLGPALADMLQTLADTGIGEKLISTLTSIIESLDSIIKSGGGAGFVAFFDIVTAFFSGLADALKNPILGPAIKTIAVALGTITALSFIGKFTGLTTLFGWLIKLSSSAGVMKLLDKLPGIGAMGSGGRHVATPGGRHAGPTLSARAGSAVKGGVVSALKPAALAKGGAVAALIAGAVQKFSDLKPLFSNMSSNLGKMTSGDLAGVQAGGNGIMKDVAKSNPFGAGATAGLVDSMFGTDLTGVWDSWMDSFFDDFVPQAQDAIITFFSVTVPEFIGSVGDGIWTGVQTFGAWLGEMWQGAVDWFVNLPFMIGEAVGFLWGQVQNFGDWLAEVWLGAVIWFQELPTRVGEAAGNIWQFIQGIGPWLAGVWNGFVAWLQNLPSQISAVAGNIWKFIQGIGPWLVTVWNGFVTWLQGLPQKISTAAGDIWRNIQGIGSWLSGIWSSIYNWAIGIPKKIGDAIGNVFRFVTGSFSAGVDSGNQKARGGYHGGSVGPKAIRRALGGTVPGVRSNSDTVPAMLTPGEFVIRKAIVNRVGEENMARFNSGVMSYAQLLQAAMANSTQNKQKSDKGGPGTGISFFNGGGIVPTLPPSFPGGPSSPGAPPSHGDGGNEGAGGGFYVENLIVNNPVPETTSDSLPRTIRKLSYVGTTRGGRK